MIQFISWAIMKQLTESESILPKRGIKAHFRACLQSYILLMSVHKKDTEGVEIQPEHHQTIMPPQNVTCSDIYLS